MKTLKNILTNNIKRKIVSALIAICVWVFVYNYNDPVITKPFYNIPVQIINEESLTKINKVYEVIEGNFINIKLKGKQSVINSLKISDIIATADLDKLSEVNAVRIHIDIKTNDKDKVEIIYNGIDTLKVELDDYVEKVFKLEINEYGELDNNYYIKSRETDVQNIKISGAKNLVSRVAKVVIEPNLTNIKPNHSSSYSVRIYDNYGTLINNPKLNKSKNNVFLSYDVLSTKTIPVKIDLTGSAPYGYKLKNYNTDISKITIAGNSENLSNIKELTLKYNINNLRGDITKEYNVQENLGDKFINISNNKVINLSIFTKKLAIKDFIIDVNEIMLLNLDLDTELLYLDNNKIILKIMGRESDLEKLDVDILNPYIDLNKAVIGENEISIHIYDLENITLVNNPKVLIELKELIRIDDKVDEKTEDDIEKDIQKVEDEVEELEDEEVEDEINNIEIENDGNNEEVAKIEEIKDDIKE